MINLLPPVIKENYQYARRNVVVMRWLAGLLVGFFGIVLVIGGGWVFLRQSANDIATQNTNTKAELDRQNVDKVQAQVQDISNNLKLVVDVLSREVLFSKLLTQIGSALPNGAVLTGLDIASTTGGLNLDAAARDYQTASQIQVNLADPDNKIFSKADLETIECSDNGTATAFSNYPCKVQIRAQFATNNSFSFITKGAAK